ncbi:MAG: hypothetical protein GDA53_00015 [Rhodobacteraceae bacterium]|nr:hypothetical protein [Paracoccaceae bacterium]
MAFLGGWPVVQSSAEGCVLCGFGPGIEALIDPVASLVERDGAVLPSQDNIDTIDPEFW